MQNCETIIIGQGLAGSVLGLQMLESGKDFIIVDNGHKYSSSLVAAGMYNPVVFRKPSLSFKAKELLSFLKPFYAHWEKEFGVQLHYDRGIVKLFTSIEEVNNWSVKAVDPECRPFMDADLIEENFHPHIKAEFGAGKVLQGGNVDLGMFLDHTRQRLSDKLLLGEAEIEASGSEWLVRTTEGEVKGKRVILCQGHRPLEFFDYLPLGNTKGDVLTIYCPEWEGMDVLNKGFFIMPLGGGYHRIGATFEWNNKSYEPSPTARVELQGKIATVLKCGFSIEDQKSGLRPTVGDRRPLIGEHPELDNLYIFNGLGSKGVMLAPYYADQLIKHIWHQGELDIEVDIKRYIKHYGNSKN